MRKRKNVVSQVKVKLYLGPLAGELAAELPFTLMHPKVNIHTPPCIHIAVVQIAIALCCEYCGVLIETLSTIETLRHCSA